MFNVLSISENLKYIIRDVEKYRSVAVFKSHYWYCWSIQLLPYKRYFPLRIVLFYFTLE